MQAIDLIRQIPLPEQDLKKLSFCDSAKVQRVDEWVSNLRATQALQTSAMLYEALPEVSRLNCSAQVRFEMLELLRPYVHHCIDALSKSFLHQPISLPEGAQKAAIVAQSLQKNMVDGYAACVKNVLEEKRQKHVSEEYFSASLHRAITGYGLLFYRSYQIYSLAPKGLWQAIHALFQISDHFDLLDKSIKDPLLQKPPLTSIQDAYMCVVLLATSRVNQLSQKDIGAIYRAFREWSHLIRFRVGTSDSKEAFYCINLSRDSAPMYKSRLGEAEKNDLVIELDFAALLSQLSKQTKDTGQELGNASAIKVPRDVSAAALSHVIDTLGNTALRKQERRPIQASADICIGLSDCHYFLSNNRPFDAFTRSLSRGDQVEDTFLSGLTPRDSFSEHSNGERPCYRVSLQNVSQGGFCLFWEGNRPIKVEGGDLIGVKEFGKKTWSIGVVRWIRQRKTGSQLGVQLLSDRAEPAAISQCYDMGGDSDFMRALHLPSSKFMDIPASFITASIPFQEYDKVKIMTERQKGSAKLDQCLFSAGNIQQFLFHSMDVRPDESRSEGDSWS